MNDERQTDRPKIVNESLRNTDFEISRNGKGRKNLRRGEREKKKKEKRKKRRQSSIFVPNHAHQMRKKRVCLLSISQPQSLLAVFSCC